MDVKETEELADSIDRVAESIAQLAGQFDHEGHNHSAQLFEVFKHIGEAGQRIENGLLQVADAIRYGADGEP